MGAEPVKLRLPPGVFKQGTDYASAGRWLDSDLIRWENGVLKAINGWQRTADLASNTPVPPLVADPAVEAVRSGQEIARTDGSAIAVLGSNKKIYQASQSFAISDVTPIGFPADIPKDAVTRAGYGRFRYGFGLYGTRRPTPLRAEQPAFTWGFDAWGDWPVAVARGRDEHVFIKRTTDPRFGEVAASPTGANDLVVTDERHLMLVGKTGDARYISWSDRENYDEWVPSVTNTAGGQRVAGVGKLLACVKVQSLILIIGETDAFAGQYLGPPYVYGFARVGNNCGIASSAAVVATSSFAMWYGNKSFWIYDGTLRQVPCDLLEYFENNLDQAQSSKITACANSDYSELWWLYQSVGATECDSYVAYNYRENIWYHGKMDRTLILDKYPMANVLGVSSTGLLYDHEVPNAGYSGALPYITSGPVEAQNGKRLLGMAYLLPDDEPDGNVSLRIDVRDAPKLPPRYSMNFALTALTPTTGIMGRDIRFTFQSVGNQQWTLGDLRAIPVNGATPFR